jgi:hypothetical protein
MKSKIANLSLAALFVLFAGLQYNDPDPFQWMALYFYTALACVFAAYRRSNPYVLWLGILGCLVWLASLLPEFVQWLKMGAPNIAGEMKASDPHIEFTREFLGLAICLAVLAWQLTKAKRRA